MRYIVFWMLFLIISNQSSIGQTKEYIVKAALIEKFSNYIEWPSDHPFSGSTEIKFGIIGESDFGNALKEIYTDTRIKNKRVGFVNYGAENNSDVEVLIIGKMKNKDFDSLLTRIKKKPILIIADEKEYSKSGPHISFFITEKGNIRFKFNKNTFSETGLYVSNMLLRYAEVIE